MILGITIYEGEPDKVILYTDRGEELVKSKSYIRRQLGQGEFNRLLKD